MRGKLLLLCLAFPPKSVSGATRPFRFYRYLPQFGYEPHVIAEGVPNAKPFENVTWAPVEAARRPKAERRASCARRVQQLLLPYNESLPWAPHAIAAAEEIIPQLGITHIFSTSPPLSTHLAALSLSRKYNLPWVADFRDPLFGNPFRARKILGCEGFNNFYNRRLERWIFRKADVVIANTDVIYEAWSDRYPQWKHKFQLLWNGFDPAEELESVRCPAGNGGWCLTSAYCMVAGTPAPFWRRWTASWTPDGSIHHPFTSASRARSTTIASKELSLPSTGCSHAGAWNITARPYPDLRQ